MISACWALGWAAALGLVCYGPGEGGRSTFVRLADWSGWRDVDPFEGGAFALQRFLHAYGPSTEPEFSRWFAIAPPITHRLFEASRDELAEVEVEGSERWMLRSDLAADIGAAPDAVHLLPHFDAFVVGSHPRSQLIDHTTPVGAMSPGTAAPFAVLLHGGRVAGPGSPINRLSIGQRQQAPVTCFGGGHVESRDHTAGRVQHAAL